MICMSVCGLSAVGTYGFQRQCGSSFFPLDWVARLVPGHITAAQCECTVSLLHEERRHTGARKLIRSGTVGNNCFVTRQFPEPRLNFLRRDMDRTLNGARHSRPYMRSNNIQNDRLASIHHRLGLGCVDSGADHTCFAHIYLMSCSRFPDVQSHPPFEVRIERTRRCQSASGYPSSECVLPQSRNGQR